MKKLLKEVEAEKQSFFGKTASNYQVTVTTPTPINSYSVHGNAQPPIVTNN
jgi:hypothetical protein